MSKHEAILATDAYIQVTGQKVQAKRLWHPPAFEKFRLRPRLKYKVCWAVDRAREDKLTLRRSVCGGQILHRRELRFSFCFSSSTIASSSSKRAAQSWR